MQKCSEEDTHKCKQGTTIMCLWENWAQLRIWIMGRNKAWSLCLCTVLLLGVVVGVTALTLTKEGNEVLNEKLYENVQGLDSGRSETTPDENSIQLESVTSLSTTESLAPGTPELNVTASPNISFTEVPDEDGTCLPLYSYSTESNISAPDLDTLNLTERWSECEVSRFWIQCKEDKRKPKAEPKKGALKVFLVPHSHNDAGWLRTFKEYYSLVTKNVLDNMLKHLRQDRSLKFTWAEISFFDLWWKDLDYRQRAVVRRLVRNKQLEFIGGGWIMADEASPHYVSYLTQMIEGHQWLHQELNYTPTRAWSIDPFGLSTSFAVLNKEIGFKSSVITRVHYAMKKLLGEQQNFEFFWRQSWDPNGEADILTHMMPSTTYDTADTCGPTHSICTRFSQEMLGERYFDVNDQTAVRERALQVWDQFRKKSHLFKTNNILVPIGGDFKWSKDFEWKQGLKYTKTIVDFINSNKDLDTEVTFSTLENYFQALENEIHSLTFSPKSVIGDFFTYADRYNDYWSGYYTSRIFHKTTDRQLLGLLRGAEVSFTLMTAEVFKGTGTMSYKFIDSLFDKISESRRTLSLFQHHDGITGTSKDHVVRDYAYMMDESITKCQFVMQQSLFILSHLRQASRNGLQIISSNDTFLEPLQFRDHAMALWSSHEVKISEGQKPLLTIMNPLMESKMELVRVTVATPNVKVVDLDGAEIPSEIHPILHYQKPGTKITERLEVASDEFQLVFVAQLKPFETKSFILQSSARTENGVKISVFNKQAIYDSKLYHTFRISNFGRSQGANITISNSNLALRFHENGEMASVTKDGEEIPLDLTYHHYNTWTSGVYLFRPYGKARYIENENPGIVVVEGKLESYVQVYFETVKQRMYLTKGLGFEANAINVDLEIDIRAQYNYELIMRVGTNLKTDGKFYTDSNSFQMMSRKYIPNIPISANYYPITTSAYLEDDNLRITILTGQPGGVSSLESGQLEIMLDRILHQDDARGVGQGGYDNLRTLSKFKILVERPSCASGTENGTSPLSPRLSLEAHHHLHHLTHPSIPFVNLNASSQELDDVRDYSPESSGILPCDIHLAAIMTLPRNCLGNSNDCSMVRGNRFTTGSLLHRVGFDSRFATSQLQERCDMEGMGSFKLSDVFGTLMASKVERTFLNFISRKNYMNYTDSVSLRPMEVYAFKSQYRGRQQE